MPLPLLLPLRTGPLALSLVLLTLLLLPRGAVAPDVGLNDRCPRTDPAVLCNALEQPAGSKFKLGNNNNENECNANGFAGWCVRTRLLGRAREEAVVFGVLVSCCAAAPLLVPSPGSACLALFPEGGC
jgi:hypothetical protein